jgi:glycosyltransferase involved in cell wall biosynthesis
VLLDISRLIWRAHRAGPSGIDRVELAYAQHFLAPDARRTAYPVIHVFGRLFGVNLNGARQFVRRLAARWPAGSLEGQQDRASGLIGQYATLLMGQWRIGVQLRSRLKRHREPPVFLVVSHHHLSRDPAIRRIRRVFRTRCVCFLHDLIAIGHPEYFPAGTQQKYLRVAETIRCSFDAVIANSQATADSLRHFFCADARAPAAKIHVAPPGVRVSPAPAAVAEARQAPNSVPYFVVLGTIEPRKNHLLLLNLWTRLAADLAEPPRLIVIGSRGWENEHIIDRLEQSRRTHGLVEERNRLDDRSVAALLSRARALLLPSFVEGFGLPLAEALASKVPVICSDIPVFRELGRGAPDYVDPPDLEAWRKAVIDYSRPDSSLRAAQLERLAHWRAPTWTEHFEIVERALDEVAAGPGFPP